MENETVGTVDESPRFIPLVGYPTLSRAFEQANAILLAEEPIPERLKKAIQAFESVDRFELPTALFQDFELAVSAMVKAASGDLSGVVSQYQRLVNTTLETANSNRMFFTIWNRTGERGQQPCILLCQINVRGLKLLEVSRSRKFVSCLAERLGAKSYPEEVLASRMQGVDVILSAGTRPHVLFADFVAMGPVSGIDPATAGGLLFNSFGDLFLDQMPIVERAFPNVAEWFKASSTLRRESIRLLTTAHVQGHDLCGHSVPYNLNDAVRVQADPFVRGPLEEFYADTQAMWIYSAASTRAFFAACLSDVELDAIPLIVAMKRLTYYAMKDASDHDARCSWMMFGYWRKAGLIRRQKNGVGEFFFDIARMPEIIDQMLTDILRVEYEIGRGVDNYELACRRFSERFGYENPLTKTWEIPDDLGALLFH